MSIKEEVMSEIDNLCSVCEQIENTYMLGKLYKIKEMLETEWLVQKHHYQQIKKILSNET